jgi:CheY-like chemotaxis protein
MRILIADDDADDRALASIALEEINSGLHVGFVNDGQELMDYLNKNISDPIALPDLIVLDLNMPRKDGREALKEIKSSQQFRNIGVVILSTSTSETDKALTLSNGARNYFVKPAEYSRLISVFKEICAEFVE